MNRDGTLNYVEMGERLKIARKKKHLTQEALGELVQSTGKYISAIETGQSQVSLPFLYVLCSKLDVTLDYATGGFMMSSNIPSRFLTYFKSFSDRQLDEVEALLQRIYENNTKE